MKTGHITRIWSYGKNYDPIYIARNDNISSDIDVYLDAGDRDEGGFYEGCLILHKILQEKGVNSQNHIFTGNHSAEYIQSNIEKYLKVLWVLIGNKAAIRVGAAVMKNISNVDIND